MRATAQRGSAAVAIAVAAAALALAPAHEAEAHDYLVASTPASGSVQTEALESVSLTFNDRVLDLTGDGSSALVQVTDAAGRHFETGCASILDRTVTAPVALGAAGDYRVEWQIVSADGHTVSDAIAFRFQTPADFAPSAGTAGRPACGEGAATTRAVPSATTSATEARPAGSSTDLPIAIGIAGGVVVLVAVGVVIVLVTARRRSQ